MAKKRKWWVISNEIVKANGKVDDSIWEELSGAIKGFVQLADSCNWAGYYGAEKWQKVFLGKMIEQATTIGQWKAVAREAEELSDEWNKAINKVYLMTRNTNILYRWDNLRLLLPQKHPLMEEVKAEMARIRSQKRVKKFLAEQ